MEEIRYHDIFDRRETRDYANFFDPRLLISTHLLRKETTVQAITVA